MNKEAINRVEQLLIVLYKDFKELEVNQESVNIKELGENGIASAIGALEIMKLNASKE